MKSESFTSIEDAREWVVRSVANADVFAAKEGLWCVSIATLDKISTDTISFRTIYADDRGDIEKIYEKILAELNENNHKYYVVNNFSFNSKHEYFQLLERLRF